MTGLDEREHHIVEISAVVTDCDLNVLDEGLNLVIHQPPEKLDLMDEVVRNMHRKSGLTQAVRDSKISLAEAEQRVLAYIKKHVPQPQLAPLCGNSIHADRRFLRRFMPDIDQHLHYRMIDVTTVRLLAKFWLPAVEQKRPPKRDNHRALDDILESIAEMRFYKDHLFFLKELPS